MKTAVKPAAGRPKDLEKRGAILAAAAGLFLEQGFERTTVEAIAARAGVSKLTVYSHFEGKEGLFKALIVEKCNEHFEARDFAELAVLGPHEALARIAGGFLSLMYHPDVLSLHRVLMTAARQDASMNVTFWDTGPAPTIDSLARLLKRFDAAGELRVPNAQVAADQFLSMLKGVDHLRVLLNVGEIPGARRLKTIANDTV
ncbi:MAG: TetR/AcrR family transcriptional regulator, partial [Gammaproteobacteria bacterium]